LAPCPLGKELVGTHPKRIYFFLTTQPRQNFPEPPETPAAQHRIISPSLTSDEKEEEEDRVERRRSEISPSPEVDLSTSELDDEMAMSSSGSFSIPDTHNSSRSYSRQTKTPPLEGMEKEFTQMAFTLQERQMSEALKRGSVSDERTTVKHEDDFDDDSSATSNDVAMDLDDETEAAALRNREAADALFGGFTDSRLGPHHALHFALPAGSSPMLRATDSRAVASAAVAAYDSVDLLAWRNPETVELDELDDLFEAY